MKIIFMGTPDYAEKILARLIKEDGIDVIAVYTQPDKPVGRKKILTAPPVKTLAQSVKIPVYQPIKLREPSIVEELLEMECDFIVVAAYGQILPKEILEHAPSINLHASILPAYRGASPIQQTLLNGDTETGVTAMLMDIGLDTGDIIKISKIAVGDDEMVESLFERLTQCAADLTVDVLKNYEQYPHIPQDETLATHCTKITKEDGKVTFDDAQLLYNKYRAFTPWPAITLKSGLKLKKIAIASVDGSYEAGKILSVEKEAIRVGCKKGSIYIYNVQAPSKKEVEIRSYINGKRLKVEDTLY